MKILLSIPGLSFGGYETLVVAMANSLILRGHQVKLLVLSTRDDLSDSLIVQKDDVIVCKPRKFKNDIGIILRVGQVIKDFKPDVIQSTSFFDCIICKFAMILLGKQIPQVLPIHFTPYRKKSWNLSNLLKEYIISKVIKLSDIYYVATYNKQIELCESVYGFDKLKFRTIHNGIDIDYFSHDEYKGSDEFSCLERKDNFTIVNVASLKLIKDHLTLLKAVKALDKKYKNWNLIIIGADYEENLKEYHKFVYQIGLNSKISFMGTVDDVRQYLAIADVFVLSSLTEALPVSVIEAIAMSVPCIVTDVGGNCDIITHGENGFIVQPKDYNAIAEYLFFLIKNSLIRQEMKLKAREKAVKFFNKDKMIQKYIELYEEIIKAN